MSASLVYPADMPFLAGRYAYDQLADDLGQALGDAVALCPLSPEATLPAGPVILHATPAARPLGEAAARTVVVNADPAHLPAVLATEPLALVTLAAMAVWRVEPEQAASAGIWVHRAGLPRISDLLDGHRADDGTYRMIVPARGTTLPRLLAALLRSPPARTR